MSLVFNNTLFKKVDTVPFFPMNSTQHTLKPQYIEFRDIVVNKLQLPF